MGAERRVPVWVAVLLCLGAVALITLLVDGTAVGAFARHVQYALAAVGVFACSPAGSGCGSRVVMGTCSRRGASSPASTNRASRSALRVDSPGCATTRSMRRPTRRSSAG